MDTAIPAAHGASQGTVPPSDSLEHRLNRDLLLRQFAEAGLKLEDIGGEFGVSWQRAQQLLHQRGLHGLWKQRARDRPNQRQLYGRLHSCLTARELALAEEASWAHARAVQYSQSKGHRVRLAMDTFVQVFQRYDAARQQGKGLSLKQLSAHLPISFVHVGRVLEAIKLSPLYGSQRRSSPTEKVWLARSVDTPFSVADLGYFLRLPASRIESWYDNNGIRPRRRYPPARVHNERITYRDASQIYEAADLLFTPEETAYLLDRKPVIVAHALAYRDEIALGITASLQQIFADLSIATPYRSAAQAAATR